MQYSICLERKVKDNVSNESIGGLMCDGREGKGSEGCVIALSGCNDG